MDRLLFKLKPDVINALFPMFLRNLLVSFVIVLVLYVITQLLVLINVLARTTNLILLWMAGSLVFLAIAPLLFRIVILLNTIYYFYHTHVISEFEFVVVKKYSLPYGMISNITTDVSVWDRMCRSGDITLHTPEDSRPDLVLRYIKKPRKMEKIIYDLIDRQKGGHHRPHTHHGYHHK